MSKLPVVAQNRHMRRKTEAINAKQLSRATSNVAISAATRGGGALVTVAGGDIAQFFRPEDLAREVAVRRSAERMKVAEDLLLSGDPRSQLEAVQHAMAAAAEALGSEERQDFALFLVVIHEIDELLEGRGSDLFKPVNPDPTQNACKSGRDILPRVFVVLAGEVVHRLQARGSYLKAFGEVVEDIEKKLPKPWIFDDVWPGRATESATGREAVPEQSKKYLRIKACAARCHKFRSEYLAGEHKAGNSKIVNSLHRSAFKMVASARPDGLRAAYPKLIALAVRYFRAAAPKSVDN